VYDTVKDTRLKAADEGLWGGVPEEQRVHPFPPYQQTNVKLTPTVFDEFQSLQDVIVTYLDDADAMSSEQGANNKLTLEILDVVARLVSFGFYYDVAEIETLIKQLVDCLNTSNDEMLEGYAKDENSCLVTTAKVRSAPRSGVACPSCRSGAAALSYPRCLSGIAPRPVPPRARLPHP